jgi:hypothetical protein
MRKRALAGSLRSLFVLLAAAGALVAATTGAMADPILDPIPIQPI